jgi:hypothetical protein
MSVEQSVIEKLRILPLDKQQEVLDFVEFLTNRLLRQQNAAQQWEGVTALEAAQRVMGTVGDGPPDLSTNPAYMDGFGES